MTHIPLLKEAFQFNIFFDFYNRVGFKTSAEYDIYPTGGYPMEDPRCMMCQETFPGLLDTIEGYVVYDMYYNA